jgi:hypothetical protein
MLPTASSRLRTGVRGKSLALKLQWNAGVLAGWPAGVCACVRRRRDVAGPAAQTAALLYTIP